MPGLKAELSCRAKAVPLGVGQHLSSAQEGKSLQALTGGSECLCQHNARKSDSAQPHAGLWARGAEKLASRGLVRHMWWG